MKTVLVLSLTLAGWGILTAAEKPNFIIINIDDLGYADIGPFGSDNKTPNLDRMAREGRKLTSHYAAPVCSPSRASLMTGCYPKRALPIPHVLFPDSAIGLNPEERTIAEILKDAGYATACIGKWHLGDQPEFMPIAQGFDSYYGIPYSNDMGPAADGARSSAPGPDAKPPQKKPKSDGTPPLPLIENDKVIGRIRVDGQFAMTRLYTEHAVEFLREKKDKPFFLYLAHNAVHFPLYPSKDFIGKSPNGLIGDWAQEVDWSVGQVLDALRELKLEEKTLVIFTSDNGGQVGFGSNNHPLRGSKAETYEGGIRVCTLAWWPGKIPAGTHTDAITSMMDILPTFAHLAGAPVPADRKIDGVDIWPVLTGDPSQPPRDTFFCYRGLTLEAVRSGPWKLRLPLAGGGKGKKKGKSELQLYNLADDIGEKSNVAGSNPEVVRRLQALAQSMEDDLGLEGIGPGCRPLGRVENPKPFIAVDGSVREDAVGTEKSFK